MSTPDDERSGARDATSWSLPPWDTDPANVIDLRDDTAETPSAASWQVQWPLPDAPYAEPSAPSAGDQAAAANGGADPLYDPLTGAYDPVPTPLADDTYGGGNGTAPRSPSLLDLGGADEPLFEEPDAVPDYPWNRAAYEQPVSLAPVGAYDLAPVDVPTAAPQEAPPVDLSDYDALMRPAYSPPEAPEAPPTPEAPARRHVDEPRVGRRVTADDLTIARRGLDDRHQAQASGWRRLFGRGARRDDEPTLEELEQNRLLGQLRAPLPDGHRLAVISLKGGVGKTTATAVLGSTLASQRIDRVVAIDANPDRGTLADKVERTTQATVRDLITDRRSIGRYATLQRYVNRTPSRLEVLASEADPAASHAFDEADYAAALDMLERFYNIILTDCGTGLLHAATRAALSNADSVVVVSSSSLDGARSASATLDWLEAHGREDLARNAVAVVNEVRQGIDELDVDRIEEHFASRCRAVQRVPYDPHLAAGSVIDPDELAPETRDAYMRIAVAVVQGAAPERGDR